jgi:predicted ester cyclase
MADDQNKALSRRIWEIFQSGNLDELDDVLASDAAYHGPQDPFGDLRGPEHIKRLFQMYRSAFSNLRFDMKLQVAEGEYVCSLLQANGDNTGELMGQPATGKHSAVLVTEVDRIADGKIVESWSCWDTLSMLQQLGLAAAGAQPSTGTRTATT